MVSGPDTCRMIIGDCRRLTAAFSFIWDDFCNPSRHLCFEVFYE